MDFSLTEEQIRIRDAVQDGDDYVIDGQRVIISRVEQSDLMILLARTGDRDAERGEGLSLFLIDLREAAAGQKDALTPPVSPRPVSSGTCCYCPMPPGLLPSALESVVRILLS